jgi:hypothetical protein
VRVHESRRDGAFYGGGCTCLRRWEEGTSSKEGAHSRRVLSSREEAHFMRS